MGYTERLHVRKSTVEQKKRRRNEGMKGRKKGRKKRGRERRRGERKRGSKLAFTHLVVV